AVRPLDAERTTLLIDAVREGLLNVQKHADASTVVVSLGEVDGGVQVAVADDGSPRAHPPAGVGGLVVDDPPVGRAGVALLLRGDPALVVVGSAESGRTALERAPQLLPDLVLL